LTRVYYIRFISEWRRNWLPCWWTVCISEGSYCLIQILHWFL